MGLGNFLFGPTSEEIREAEETERRNRELDRRYQPGGSLYNTIAQRDGPYAANRTINIVAGHRAADEHDIESEANQVDDAFGEGLNEGAANIRHAIGDTITGTLGTVFKLLPWYVWLALGVGAFFYFGGPRLVRRFKP